MRKKLLAVCIGLIMYNTNAQHNYCAPYSMGCDFGDMIDSFEIPSIGFSDLNTGCAPNQHDVKTSTVISLEPGLLYNYQTTHQANNQKIKIWIDFNNDGVFEDGGNELVSTTQSSGSYSSSVGNGIIQIPADIPAGNYRMRIFGKSGSEYPTPCGGGFGYGEAHDYTVQIAATASCVPMSIESTEVVPLCEDGQFKVLVTVSNIGNGNQIISDGNSNQNIPQTGTYTFGPYDSDAEVTLTAPHGINVNCDVFVGTFTYHCPIVGENCTNPIVIDALPYSHQAHTEDYIDSADLIDSDLCLTWQTQGNDVFYAYTPTSSETITLYLKNMTESKGAFQILDGCYDDASTSCIGSASNMFSADNLSIENVGLNAGQTYYIWVSKSIPTATMGYTLELSTSLGVNTFELSDFKVSPNPTTDVVHISSQDQISLVEIYDLNGKRLKKVSYNNVEVQLGVSDLPSGNYILKAYANEKISGKLLIVK